MALPLIYRTTTMLAALNEMEPTYTFLRDRYFPTNPDLDIFHTEDVLMDIKNGQQRMAPVVLPRRKGVLVAREGFKTERMTPPFVAPERLLTLDDLNTRGFGEALFSDMSAEERAAAILGQDLVELDKMHDNREEYIAARCMMGNGYELKQWGDKYGSNEFQTYEIHFYDGAANPCRFTPATPWNQPGATIYDDLAIMVRMLTKAGKPVSEIVGNPATIDAIINDDKIYKMLDNRRMDWGQIKPESMPQGASYYGYITVAGRNIALYSYDAEFSDEQAGTTEQVFKPGECVLTAESAGRGLYGAVVQVEQADGEPHTYKGTRVPKFTADADADTRKLRLASRPLYVPRYINPWVSADTFQ